MTMLALFLAFLVGAVCGVAISPSVRDQWKMFKQGVSELIERRRDDANHSQ